MPRFLVVDDSATMRAYVRAALEDEPGEVEVVEAASGFDALRLLPRSRFDLVITDINMPDINGLELIRFVRESEHHKQVAVMIISTQSSERDKERGLKLGANGFLPKPFTPDALREAAQRSLAGAHAAGLAGEGQTSGPAGGPHAPDPAEGPRTADPVGRPRSPGSDR